MVRKQLEMERQEDLKLNVSTRNTEFRQHNNGRRQKVKNRIHHFINFSTNIKSGVVNFAIFKYLNTKEFKTSSDEGAHHG